MTMNVLVEIKRRKRGTPAARKDLAAELRASLSQDAFCFAGPDGMPDLMIVHQGRAFGLALAARHGALDERQRARFALLRNAGMRIEVARSRAEALAHLAHMGIALNVRRDLAQEIKALFRDESGRR